MMKKIYHSTIILTFCFFNIFPSHSQGWERTFGTTETDKGNRIVQLDDGNLIIAGTEYDSEDSYDTHIYLKKISPTGNLLSQINIIEDRAIYLQDFIRTDDNGLLGVGFYLLPDSNIRQTYCFKTNLDGEVLWSKFFNNFSTFSQANAAIQLTNGHYLLAGGTKSPFSDTGDEAPNSAAYMMKISTDGQVLSSKIYADSLHDMHGDVLLETSNSEILMSGYYSHPLANPGDTFLGKYDSEGHEIWFQISSIPTVVRRMLELEDNSYLIGGWNYGSGNSHISLKKIDSLGQQVWFTLLSSSDYQMGDIIETEDGGFVISGNKSYLFTPENAPHPEKFYDGLLIKTDQDGQILWNRTFGNDGEDRLSDVVKTLDGGYAMCGYSDSFAEGARQTYALKTTGDGIILSTSKIESTNKTLLVYPNPIKDLATIDLPHFNLTNGQFILFDSKGQIIQQNEFNGSTYTFKKHNLPNGVYFFQILNNKENVGGGKIIID